MKYNTLLLTVVQLALSITATPVNPTYGAVYTITDSLSGNYVLSSSIDASGKLTPKTATSTKGKGGHGSTAQLQGDPLFSEDAMLVSGDRLYTVNTGSDTVSVFSINPNNPTELKLIGEPVNTGGEFPVSIGISAQTGQVCVLNGGKVNGVNCFKQDPHRALVEIPNTKRSLGLNIATPPTGPVNTTSQVIFSADGSTLYAAVKGTSAQQPGFIAAWKVDPKTGALSKNFVKSPPPSGGGQPFSMALIPGTNAMISPDPVLGWDVFQFDAPTSLTITNGTANVIPGEGAVCWVRRSTQTGNYYIADRNTGMITEIHVNPTTLGSFIVAQHPQGDNVLLDEEQIGTVLGKDYLYILAAGEKSIITVALNGPGNTTTLQHLDLDSFSSKNVIIDPNFLAGIAVYTPPSCPYY